MDTTSHAFKGISDTWVWNGSDWSKEHSSTSPPALEHPVLAYDAIDGKIVMYGVMPENKAPFFIPETWVWDGNNWTREDPATSPPAFGDYTMAFDTAQNNVVLLGGFYTGGPLSGHVSYYNWVWDGTNWTEEASGAAAFTSKYGVAVCMAYDAAEGKVVMTGTDGNNQPGAWTRVWNGNNWTYAFPVSTPAFIGPAMAYDAAHKQVVMFGGATAHSHFPENGTFVWDKRWCELERTVLNCEEISRFTQKRRKWSEKRGRICAKFRDHQAVTDPHRTTRHFPACRDFL